MASMRALGAAILASALLFAPQASAQVSAALTQRVFDPIDAAEGAIDAANARDLFVATASERPETGFAGVRHRVSGLACAWGPRDAIQIHVFDSGALPRSDDVGCSVQSSLGTHTLYATRYAAVPQLGSALDTAEAAIRQRFPDARRISAPAARSPSWRLFDAPPSESAYFLLTGPDGEETVTAVSIAQVGAWTIKMRYTGPAAFAARADAVWAQALYDIVRAQPPLVRTALVSPDD